MIHLADNKDGRKERVDWRRSLEVGRWRLQEDPLFFVIFCSLAAIEVRFAIFLYFDMLSTTDGSTF